MNNNYYHHHQNNILERPSVVQRCFFFSCGSPQLPEFPLKRCVELASVCSAFDEVIFDLGSIDLIWKKQISHLELRLAHDEVQQMGGRTEIRKNAPPPSAAALTHQAFRNMNWKLALNNCLKTPSAVLYTSRLRSALCRCFSKNIDDLSQEDLKYFPPPQNLPYEFRFFSFSPSSSYPSSAMITCSNKDDDDYAISNNTSGETSSVLWAIKDLVQFFVTTTSSDDTMSTLHDENRQLLIPCFEHNDSSSSKRLYCELPTDYPVSDKSFLKNFFFTIYNEDKHCYQLLNMVLSEANVHIFDTSLFDPSSSPGHRRDTYRPEKLYANNDHRYAGGSQNFLCEPSSSCLIQYADRWNAFTTSSEVPLFKNRLLFVRSSFIRNGFDDDVGGDRTELCSLTIPTSDAHMRARKEILQERHLSRISQRTYDAEVVNVICDDLNDVLLLERDFGGLDRIDRVISISEVSTRQNWNTDPSYSAVEDIFDDIHYQDLEAAIIKIVYLSLKGDLHEKYCRLVETEAGEKATRIQRNEDLEEPFTFRLERCTSLDKNDDGDNHSDDNKDLMTKILAVSSSTNKSDETDNRNCSISIIENVKLGMVMNNNVDDVNDVDISLFLIIFSSEIQFYYYRIRDNGGHHRFKKLPIVIRCPSLTTSDENNDNDKGESSLVDFSDSVKYDRSVRVSSDKKFFAVAATSGFTRISSRSSTSTRNASSSSERFQKKNSSPPQILIFETKQILDVIIDDIKNHHDGASDDKSFGSTKNILSPIKTIICRDQKGIELTELDDFSFAPIVDIITSKEKSPCSQIPHIIVCGRTCDDNDQVDINVDREVKVSSSSPFHLLVYDVNEENHSTDAIVLQDIQFQRHIPTNLAFSPDGSMCQILLQPENEQSTPYWIPSLEFYCCSPELSYQGLKLKEVKKMKSNIVFVGREKNCEGEEKIHVEDVSGDYLDF